MLQLWFLRFLRVSKRKVKLCYFHCRCIKSCYASPSNIVKDARLLRTVSIHSSQRIWNRWIERLCLSKERGRTMHRFYFIVYWYAQDSDLFSAVASWKGQHLPLKFITAVLRQVALRYQTWERLVQRQLQQSSTFNRRFRFVHRSWKSKQRGNEMVCRTRSIPGRVHVTIKSRDLCAWCFGFCFACKCNASLQWRWNCQLASRRSWWLEGSGWLDMVAEDPNLRPSTFHLLEVFFFETVKGSRPSSFELPPNPLIIEQYFFVIFSTCKW